MPLPPCAPLTRRRRALALLFALLAVGSLLSGCARVLAALAVQPDDTVVGEIVVAIPERGPDDPGSVITPPAELAGDIEVSEYRQDGYAGSLVRFSDLTFVDLGRLMEAAGPAAEKVEFTLRRAGDRVLIDGAVDLTSIAVDRADFQLKISFPGRVVETNGEAESGTVSWVFTPGEVGDIAAVVAFDDPNGPSVLTWSLVLASLVAMAAGAVVLLALRARNPPVGAPTR